MKIEIEITKKQIAEVAAVWGTTVKEAEREMRMLLEGEWKDEQYLIDLFDY